QPLDLVAIEEAALRKRRELGAADVPLAMAAADPATIEHRHLQAASREIGGVDQRQAAAGENDVEVGLRAAIGAALVVEGEAGGPTEVALQRADVRDRRLSVGQRKQRLDGAGKTRAQRVDLDPLDHAVPRASLRSLRSL